MTTSRQPCRARRAASGRAPCLEQRLEVALAKAAVALALDELEEDRSQLVFAEDLQQQLARLPIHQDVALLQGREVFAVARNALVQQLVVGLAGDSSFTPLICSASTVSYRLVEPIAMCWMPSP